MAIASRPQAPSLPNSNVAIWDELSCEQDTLLFHVRTLVTISDTLDVDTTSLVIAPAVFFEIDTEIDVITSLLHFALVNFSFYDELDIDVFQNYVEQLLPVEEIDSSDAVGRLDNLELDLALFSTNPSFFKEFSYNEDGDLTGYSIYDNSMKDNKLLDVIFVYVAESLVQKTIHRISDDAVLNINFTYVDGNLISQTRTRA